MSNEYTGTTFASEQICSLQRRINALESITYQYVRRWSSDRFMTEYAVPCGENICVVMADDQYLTNANVEVWSVTGTKVYDWATYKIPQCEYDGQIWCTAAYPFDGNAYAYDPDGTLARTFSPGRGDIHSVWVYDGEIYCIVPVPSTSRYTYCVVYDIAGNLQREFDLWYNTGLSSLSRYVYVNANGLFSHFRNSEFVEMFTKEGVPVVSVLAVGDCSKTFGSYRTSVVRLFGNDLYVVPDVSGAVRERWIRIADTELTITSAFGFLVSATEFDLIACVGTGDYPLDDTVDTNGVFNEIHGCCLVGGELIIWDNHYTDNVQVFSVLPQTSWWCYTKAQTKVDIGISPDLNALHANEGWKQRQHITDMRAAIIDLCNSHNIAGTGHPELRGGAYDEYACPQFGKFFYAASGIYGTPIVWTNEERWTVSQITRIGTTATATCAGHPFQNGESVLIVGASPVGYTGAKTVTRIDDNSFSFVVAGDLTTPATGVAIYAASVPNANDLYDIALKTWEATDAKRYSISSLSQVGGLATAICAGHPFVNYDDVLIAGATPLAYSGYKRVAVVDADTFTFTIAGATSSPASGTIYATWRPHWWRRTDLGLVGEIMSDIDIYEIEKCVDVLEAGTYNVYWYNGF